MFEPFWLAVSAAAAAAIAAATRPPDGGLDEQRVAEIEASLSPQPAGPGAPVTNRHAWRRLRNLDAFKEAVRAAEKLAAEPVPDLPDELYLDFSRTGNRMRWETVSRLQRRGRFAPLVLAECVEDAGRFLGAIEELVASVCAERTWVMPAHDRNLDNFYGRATNIDLASAALAWDLALTDYLLGERLRPETRSLIRENVSRRVLQPFREMLRGRRQADWWLTGTNNWNAVCLAGVTGAALAIEESPRRRAEFVAAAEKYSLYFLSGFTPDGYCSEGLSYWNYGFGHYVLLAETVRQATGGFVDLLARDHVRAPATFPARLEIVPGVYPAFADCPVDASPDPAVMFFLNRVLGLRLRAWNKLDLRRATERLPAAVLFAFDNAASQIQPLPAGEGPGIRTWFDHGGVLICRPAAGSGCRLAVALKGGHNAEHHNHNDLGTFVAVVGDTPVVLDPGREVYTARTFSSRRYESKLLNSYGHCTPVPAGALQRPGADARAVVVETDFTDERDTLVLDLTSAYDAPALDKLLRSFVYSRGGAGALEVTDEVWFSSPETFETALITRGSFEPVPSGLVLRDGGRGLRVDVDTSGQPWRLVAERIEEDAPVQPLRVAVRLADPLRRATVRLKLTPLP